MVAVVAKEGLGRLQLCRIMPHAINDETGCKNEKLPNVAKVHCYTSNDTAWDGTTSTTSTVLWGER